MDCHCERCGTRWTAGGDAGAIAAPCPACGASRAADPLPSGAGTTGRTDATLFAPPGDAAAAPPGTGTGPGADPARAGTPFGRYRLLELVGSGAMGTVWKAWDPGLGRVIALKQMAAGSAAGAESVQRFLREARLAGKLRHPNLVPVHDAGVADGRHYITMDYIEGTTLAGALGEGEVPAPGRGGAAGAPAAPDPAALRRRVRLLADVASAVGFAHQEGVVHRDLKPGNVLLDREGRPYVTDFGLAKEVSAGPASGGSGVAPSLATQGGRVLGTPAYMSPEQARGDTARIGPQSDVWALGVMLYQALTGRLPFAGATAWEVLSAVCAEEPVRPRAREPRVPADLEAVCLRALAHDPAARYADGAELAAELVRWLAGEPVRAERTTGVRRAWRTAVRRRVVLAPLLGAVVVAAAAVTWVEVRAGTRAARTRGLLAEIAGAVRALEDQVNKTAMPAAARQALAAQPLGLLDHVIADAPDLAAAYAWRARVHEILGAEAAAEADFERAFAHAERDATALCLRGLFRLRRGVRGRELPMLAYTEGRVTFQEGDPESAEQRRWREGGLADLAAALAAGAARAGAAAAPAPEAEEARLGQAWAALYAGTARGYAEALRAVEGLARPAAEKIRGRALYLLQRFDESAAAFSRTLADWPEDAEAWRLRGCARKALATVRAGKGDDVRPLLAEARADFEEALRRTPGSVRLLGDRGMVALTLAVAEEACGGDARAAFLTAARDFEAALERNPRDPVSYLNRGVCHLGLGRLDEAEGADPRPACARAVDDFDRALALDAANTLALNNRAIARATLARAQAERGEDPLPALRQAIADYGESIRLGPGFVEAYENRSDVWLAMAEAEQARGNDPAGSVGHALADAEEAVRRAPDAATAWAARGRARFRRAKAEAARGGDAEEDWRRALADYDQALARNPGLANGWRERADVRVRLAQGALARGGDGREELAAARSDYGEALRRNPRLVEAYSNRMITWVTQAQAEMRGGGDPRASFVKAIADAGEALKLNPNHEQARTLRGMAWLDLAGAEARAGVDPRPSYAKSIEDMTEVLRLNPAAGMALEYRGAAWCGTAAAAAGSGEDPAAGFARAEADFKAAIGRRWPRAGLKLGELYARRGRRADAIAAFEAVARALPAFAPAARQRIGELRAAGGAGAEAGAGGGK